MIEITEKDLQDVPLEDEYTAMLETQGEAIWKPVYEEYRRLGYRLKEFEEGK